MNALATPRKRGVPPGFRRRWPGHKGRSLSERFWEKVNRDGVGTGCWEWLGGCNPNGYGLIWTGKKLELAHRVVYRLVGLPDLPDRWTTGLVPDHLCRNTRCINPAHQEIVTQKVNSYRGESPHAKNATMTHCKKCGNEYAGANLAIVPARDKAGRPTTSRCCLTCYPGRWRYAVIKRGPPAGSRPRKHFAWVGPFNPEFTKNCS